MGSALILGMQAEKQNFAFGHRFSAHHDVQPHLPGCKRNGLLIHEILRKFGSTRDQLLASG